MIVYYMQMVLIFIRGGCSVVAERQKRWSRCIMTEIILKTNEVWVSDWIFSSPCGIENFGRHCVTVARKYKILTKYKRLCDCKAQPEVRGEDEERWAKWKQPSIAQPPKKGRQKNLSWSINFSNQMPISQQTPLSTTCHRSKNLSLVATNTSLMVMDWLLTVSRVGQITSQAASNQFSLLTAWSISIGKDRFIYRGSPISPTSVNADFWTDKN